MMSIKIGHPGAYSMNAPLTSLYKFLNFLVHLTSAPNPSLERELALKSFNSPIRKLCCWLELQMSLHQAQLPGLICLKDEHVYLSVKKHLKIDNIQKPFLLSDFPAF